MKVLDDIFSAISGPAKTRVSDPIVGTFICSWLICNWNYLALLAWGEGNVTERVSAFYIYLSHTSIFAWNSLFTFPFIITLFYLFVFPWLSLIVKFIQKSVNEMLHQQAVDVDLTRITQQEQLNKAKLRANPDKQFLEQVVQQDIDKKNEILQHIRQRTIRLESKANEALSQEKEQEAKTKEAENKAKIAKVESDKKAHQSELDKLKFESNSAKARASLASHRFPSAYFFMTQVEESLKQDGVQLSIKAYGEIIALLFGYESFEGLLADEDFSNEILAEVKYVYYDAGLASGLEKIVLEEDSENEDLTADLIFDHLQMLFEGEPFELVTIDSLEEYSKGEIENDPYGLLSGDGTSGAIAESDTIFEDIDDIHVESSNFDNGFTAKIGASASGSHRRESDVPGRTMSLSIEMKSNVVVGRYGLSSIEKGEVTAELDEYY
ncbi:hypothetical protein CTT31_11525 [Pseudoalteromonas maricaloris]|uniref:cell envelope integrity protein TolA n=1 Tax=Pseudoalteromonas maricaloris TaxID=184924 RepID=UPI0021AD7A10|nr:cell envelope integrity protein TolA [Pseudoalteromonas flavipulchra]USE69718.1 hypothetical protein CTT31_11525 [Pseudoalteromonas flavipulchra]